MECVQDPQSTISMSRDLLSTVLREHSSSHSLSHVAHGIMHDWNKYIWSVDASIGLELYSILDTLYPKSHSIVNSVCSRLYTLGDFWEDMLRKTDEHHVFHKQEAYSKILRLSQISHDTWQEWADSLERRTCMWEHVSASALQRSHAQFMQWFLSWRSVEDAKGEWRSYWSPAMASQLVAHDLVGEMSVLPVKTVVSAPRMFFVSDLFHMSLEDWRESMHIMEEIVDKKNADLWTFVVVQSAVDADLSDRSKDILWDLLDMPHRLHLVPYAYGKYPHWVSDRLSVSVVEQEVRSLISSSKLPNAHFWLQSYGSLMSDDTIILGSQSSFPEVRWKCLDILVDRGLRDAHHIEKAMRECVDGHPEKDLAIRVYQKALNVVLDGYSGSHEAWSV